MDDKYIQMIVEAVQSVKSAHHRVDQLNEVIKEIRADVKSTNQIAISVEKLAMEMKAMRKAERLNDEGKLLDSDYEELMEWLEAKLNPPTPEPEEDLAIELTDEE